MGYEEKVDKFRCLKLLKKCGYDLARARQKLSKKFSAVGIQDAPLQQNRGNKSNVSPAQSDQQSRLTEKRAKLEKKMTSLDQQLRNLDHKLGTRSACTSYSSHRSGKDHSNSESSADARGSSESNLPDLSFNAKADAQWRHASRTIARIAKFCRVVTSTCSNQTQSPDSQRVLQEQKDPTGTNIDRAEYLLFSLGFTTCETSTSASQLRVCASPLV
mmetsp:Transcript_18528/g.36261  ORF Transcript_18528/g.36261 Transcript_18528/m.36261 type:complete len:216 (+) Transcript_18528:529-1176(+)